MPCIQKLIIAAICAVLPAAAAAAEEEVTTLRIMGEPVLSWQKVTNDRDDWQDAIPRFTEIRVTVWNAGTVEAKQIQVTATLPDGRQITLSGPSTLGMNKRADYSSSLSEPIGKGGKAIAAVTCSNCRNIR